MDHALLGQALDHAPGGELVVFRADQAAGDGLECVNEAGEVSELVERFGFGQRDGCESWRALRSASVAA